MPQKQDNKKQVYDLCKSFAGAVAGEVIIAYGHSAGEHLSMIAVFLFTWLSAHITLKAL
jgi:hypothetical protein